MKKRFFNLQLFAEDAAAPATAETPAEAAAEQGKPAEQTKEPETAAETEKEEKKYSDADLDRIIGKKFAEFQAKQEKKVAEAARLAEMSAQEKAEFSLKQEQEAHAATQKKLDELMQKDALAEMSKVARKMLSDEGISIPDELLSYIVTANADETKTAVTGFAKLFKEAVETAAKEGARGTTPKLIQNNGDAPTEIEKRIAKYN